jgi:hypothetical protein
MTDSETQAARARRRRERPPAEGLRPVRIWVPDTRSPGFAEECARQARLVRESETPESHAEDEAWHFLSDTSGWTG